MNTNTALIVEEENLSTNLTMSSFESFAEQAVTLDPSFESICLDEREKLAYAHLPFAEKMARFNPDLVNTIKGIYDAVGRQIESRNELAVHIFKYRELTGQTLENVAAKLSDALGKTLSRSYIHKLYQAGRVILRVPALSKVMDTEKLATLAKVPERDLQKDITIGEGDLIRLDGVDIRATSRDQLTKKVKESYPGSIKVAPRKNKPIAVAPIDEAEVVIEVDGPLIKLKAAIESALDHGLDDEIAVALRGCLNLVTSRLLEVTSKVDAV